jgi:hypothetical protein
LEALEYSRFTEQLLQNLEKDPRVLGLVALGSMSKQDYQPDRYSDHDFFVIVEDGQQEDFRQNLAWLPRRDEIALAFRETEHGIKVVYRNGHLLEFAVFNRQELEMTSPNRYRVLLDRGGIGEQLASRSSNTNFILQSSEEEDYQAVS